MGRPVDSDALKQFMREQLSKKAYDPENTFGYSFAEIVMDEIEDIIDCEFTTYTGTDENMRDCINEMVECNARLSKECDRLYAIIEAHYAEHRTFRTFVINKLAEKIGVSSDDLMKGA